MKKPIVFIGIDVSKATLDLCKVEGTDKQHQQIPNTIKAIEKYLLCLEPAQTIIAMENTGRYNWPLYDVFSKQAFEVHVVAPLHLKKSLGLVRGKNDQVDACRIAWFIQKHYTEHKQWEPESLVIRDLKLLLTERNQLLKQKTQVQIAIKEHYLITNKEYQQKVQKRNTRRLKELSRDIKEVEKEIKQLIEQDVKLKQQAKLIQSVPGVGPVLTWNLLAKTGGFKTIKDPRKLACYAGVAPFDFQSGTSVKKRPGVSSLADKKLKTILHMAAMVASRIDPELKAYYNRKVADGKNKMAVLNAIRNKLIHRICAVVRNQKMFEMNLQVS